MGNFRSVYWLCEQLVGLGLSHLRGQFHVGGFGVHGALLQINRAPLKITILGMGLFIGFHVNFGGG